MRILEILTKNTGSNNKRHKKVIYIDDGYYSIIIRFTILEYVKVYFIEFFKKIKSIFRRNSIIKILRIDQSIISIRGNKVENSLVVVFNERVIKYYFNPLGNEVLFYKNVYKELNHLTKDKSFSLPKLISIKKENETLVIESERIKFKNNPNISFDQLKKVSDDFSGLLTNFKDINEYDFSYKGQDYFINKIDKMRKECLESFDKLYFSHGDMWKGNLLRDKNDDIYLIDFDNIIKAPKDFDVVYFILNEILNENKFFLHRVLNFEIIYYSKKNELLSFKDKIENLKENEFLFFLLKYRYNLINNDNFTNEKKSIVSFLNKLSNGYSIIDNILNKNE